MVRTLADGGSKKAVASKAPRKQLGSGGAGGSSSFNGDSPSNSQGFNLVNHAKLWPTPVWQKGITGFFSKVEKSGDEEKASSSSGSEIATPLDSGSDVVIIQNEEICSGTPCTSSSLLSNNQGKTDDDDDKENVDPSNHSPGIMKPVENGDEEDDDANEDIALSEKTRSAEVKKKISGKQKAAVGNKRRRLVLQEDSDDE